MSTVALSGIGTYWGNTIQVNSRSVSTESRTAEPAPAADQPKHPLEQELSPHELALLELGKTIAGLGTLQFRSTLNLFKSVSPGIQNPSAKHVTEAYKNQMVLQK